MPDPRPLPDEPLGVDLLNTLAVRDGQVRDQLADDDGLAAWLAVHGFAAPGSSSTRTPLLAARAAILAHLADATAYAGINEVLAHGSLHRELTDDGPRQRLQTDTPEREPAWRAVASYLDLVARDASRLRTCAHPDCILHFYDTSAKGNRRWCSMARCGNRAKAARHYDAVRGAS